MHMDIKMSSDQILRDNHASVLKEYYARYLKDIRGLKRSSILHYYDALNNISRRLKDKGLVENDIYEIMDFEYLQTIKDILMTDPDFIEMNERGRRMYSAGLNNYLRFVSGEGFGQAKGEIDKLDSPIMPDEPEIIEQNVWKRSNILRRQVIASANYMCEIDKTHESFIAESTGKPYMEGHHAIPMRLQPKFDCSLDIYANIICLCPLCHRKIHLGRKAERKVMMLQLYAERVDRLVKSGIHLSKEEFVNISIH